MISVRSIGKDAVMISRFTFTSGCAVGLQHNRGESKPIILAYK